MPSVAFVDRMIRVAEIGDELTYSVPPHATLTWDYYSLSRAMRDEGGAEQLRHEMETALSQRLRDDGCLEVDAWMRQHALEAAWEAIAATIQQRAQQQYGTTRRHRPEWHARLAKEREEAL
eukprot:3445539-Pyramimonas_sp.AAC.1